MSPIEIKDSDLASLKGRVVVLTGGSSGIGLATVELLLSIGAKIVHGDLQEPPEAVKAQTTFISTNVTIWKDLLNLFSRAKAEHGRIDCVFANAGIGPGTDYLTEDILDDKGELQEPEHKVLDVNLVGCINTVKVGIHYLRQQKDGGSIVVTASASSNWRPLLARYSGTAFEDICLQSSGYTQFAAHDYTIAKHGVLGLVRALYHPLRNTSVRLNAIAPSWTETGLVPVELVAQVGIKSQPPSVVARAAALLMTDESRHGELIYIYRGTYTNLEPRLLDAAWDAMGKDADYEEERVKLMDLVARVQEEEANKG